MKSDRINIDYRDVLKNALQKFHDEIDKAMNISRLAESIRLQPSYLSRCFKGNAHLSADQIYLICQTLKINVAERQYILALAEYNRSEVNERKIALEPVVKKLFHESQKTDHVLDLTEEQVAEEYYQDPLLQIINAAFMIDTFAKDSAKLRQALEIREAYFNEMIEKLIKLKMIEKREDRFVVLRTQTHLSKDSPIYKNLVIKRKLKSIEFLTKQSNTPRLDFTVVFTADEETRVKIHSEIMTALKKINQLVEKAPSKSVYQLSIDLFDWLS